MKRPFLVTVYVSEIHEYEIEANTIEEATTVAEQYLADGEEGTVISCDVEDSEAIPIDFGPMGERVEE